MMHCYHRSLTMREVIGKVRWLLDTGGREHALKLIKSILEQYGDADPRVIVRLVSRLISLVCKMDGCKKGCFENLDRAMWCRCSCGEMPPIKIKLDDERSTVWA